MHVAISTRGGSAILSPNLENAFFRVLDGPAAFCPVQNCGATKTSPSLFDFHFEKFSWIKSHMRANHPEIIVCTKKYCEEIFGTLENRDAHVRQTHHAIRHCCVVPDCRRDTLGFSKKAGLHRHLLSYHPNYEGTVPVRRRLLLQSMNPVHSGSWWGDTLPTPTNKLPELLCDFLKRKGCYDEIKLYSTEVPSVLERRFEPPRDSLEPDFGAPRASDEMLWSSGRHTDELTRGASIFRRTDDLVETRPGITSSLEPQEEWVHIKMEAASPRLPAHTA